MRRAADRVRTGLRWTLAAVGLALAAAGNGAEMVQEQRLGALPEPILDHPASAYSEDGLHYAYATRRGGKCLVVVDGQPGPELGYREIGWLSFSPDSKHLAYAAWKGGDVAYRGGKRFVVLDGRPGPEYDEIVKGRPTIHPDGVVEYLAIRGGVLYRVKHLP